MGEKIHFLPTFYSPRFSDSLDSEQLLRTLPGVEVGIGLSVGLGHHCEDEEGVERGDGGKVKEDSVRTKQRHEWFSELEDMSEQVSIVLIFEGGWVDWHLDCNEDECKLGGDQGACHEGGEVSRKPLAWLKAKVDQGGSDLEKRGAFLI